MKLDCWILGVVGVLSVAAGSLHAQVNEPIRQGSPPAIAVWDTMQTATDRLTSADLASEDGWTKIPRNERVSSFQGDAILTNGRVLVVLRQRGSAIDLYSVEAEAMIPRVPLALLAPGGEPASRLESVSLIENTRSAVRLEASYRTEKGESLTATFRIKRGDVAVEVSPGAGAGRLRVQCPGRFAVLPDFFADDILIDASRIPGAALQAPSDNFLLHLTGQDDAIAMCVFENREQDVRISLAGEGASRTVTGSEISFGDGGKIWVALMTGSQIWHALDVKEEDAGQVMPLDWQTPFAAQWRTDFTRTNDLTDSWEMLLPAKGSAGYLKPTWLGAGGDRIPSDRKRWTTVLGRFFYPCWVDRDGQGYVQPLKNRAMGFRGPAVIYPINRIEETPTDTYTVIDVARSCLGVGPCKYILDLEGQKQEHVGRATCATRDALRAIYEKDQQRHKRQEIETALDAGLAFVTHIRNRIEHYVRFGHEIREYLAEQSKAHPELANRLGELDAITRELDVRMEARREKVKTPKFVAQMNQDFRRDLLTYEGADVLDKLKSYTNALTQIGGNQDELVGECRWVVRSLRQQAGLMMAADPRCAELAEEIRGRCQKALTNPTKYEAARH